MTRNLSSVSAAFPLLPASGGRSFCARPWTSARRCPPSRRAPRPSSPRIRRFWKSADAAQGAWRGHHGREDRSPSPAVNQLDKEWTKSGLVTFLPSALALSLTYGYKPSADVSLIPAASNETTAASLGRDSALTGGPMNEFMSAWALFTSHRVQRRPSGICCRM